MSQARRLHGSLSSRGSSSEQAALEASEPELSTQVTVRRRAPPPHSEEHSPHGDVSQALATPSQGAEKQGRDEGGSGWERSLQRDAGTDAGFPVAPPASAGAGGSWAVQSVTGLKFECQQSGLRG